MINFDKDVKDAVKSIIVNGEWLSDFTENKREKDTSLSHYAPNKLILSNDDLEDFIIFYAPVISSINVDKRDDATKELLLRLNELKKVNSTLRVHSQQNEVAREEDATRNIKRILKSVDTILDSMTTHRATIAQRTLTILLKLFKRQAKRLYYIPNSHKDDNSVITYNIFGIKSYRKLFNDRSKSKHLVQMIKEFGKKYNITITQHTINDIKNNTSL